MSTGLALLRSDEYDQYVAMWRESRVTKEVVEDQQLMMRLGATYCYRHLMFNEEAVLHPIWQRWVDWIGDPKTLENPKLNTRYEMIEALIRLSHCSRGDAMTLVGAATLDAIVRSKHPHMIKRLNDDNAAFIALQKQWAEQEARKEASK